MRHCSYGAFAQLDSNVFLADLLDQQDRADDWITLCYDNIIYCLVPHISFVLNNIFHPIKLLVYIGRAKQTTTINVCQLIKAINYLLLVNEDRKATTAFQLLRYGWICMR